MYRNWNLHHQTFNEHIAYHNGVLQKAVVFLREKFAIKDNHVSKSRVFISNRRWYNSMVTRWYSFHLTPILLTALHHNWQPFYYSGSFNYALIIHIIVLNIWIRYARGIFAICHHMTPIWFIYNEILNQRNREIVSKYSLASVKNEKISAMMFQFCIPLSLSLSLRLIVRQLINQWNRTSTTNSIFPHFSKSFQNGSFFIKINEHHS